MRQELLAFAFQRMGPAAVHAAPAFISASDAMEIVWPLNDLLLPHKQRIEGIPYYSAHARECDDAILAFALDPRAPTLERALSPEGWRVLHDRHVGFLTVAAANEAARNREFIVIPKGLPRSDHLGAVLLSMYLRFPTAHLPNPPQRKPRQPGGPQPRKRAAALRKPKPTTERSSAPDIPRPSLAPPPPVQQARPQRRFRPVLQLARVVVLLFLVFVIGDLFGCWDAPKP